MKKLLVLLSVLATACGSEWPPTMFESPKDTDHSHVKVDPQIKPAFLSFLAHCEQYPAIAWKCKQNLQKLRTIRYAPDSTFKGNNVGVCVLSSSGARYIEIKYGVYGLDSAEFNVLVYHELGHCLLDSGHAPKDSKHIMNSYVLDERYTQKNWPTLVKDLFTQQYGWDSGDASHDCSDH